MPASWAETVVTNTAPDVNVRGFSFALQKNDDVLELRALHRPEYGAIRADWQSTEMQRRIAAGKRQLLARACGLGKPGIASVLDATAGLGRDGYTLATLGAEVSLCERQPLMVALLRDAARRAASSIEILEADAQSLLTSGRRWDVIYLDPMYPHAGKTALPQKEMQFFRDITAGDADADSLLAPARAAANRRVVVKRPLKAPPLAAQVPALTFKGTQARFDVYLVT